MAIEIKQTIKQKKNTKKHAPNPDVAKNIALPFVERAQVSMIIVPLCFFALLPCCPVLSISGKAWGSPVWVTLLGTRAVGLC